MRLRTLVFGLPFLLVLACGGDDGGVDVGGDDDVSGDAATPADATTDIDGSPLTDGSPVTDGGPGDGSSDGSPDDDAGYDGGETDVGCGGAVSPACADGKMCKIDGDCESGACSTLTDRCVPPSCKGGANGGSGLETCGSTEPGAEGCCQSLALPVRTTRRLDKYEITSGRLRAFLDAIAAASGGEPNIRAFAEAYASAHPDSELGVLATTYPGLLDILPVDSSPNSVSPLPVFLGVFPFDPINSLDGCYMGLGAEGHATYWQEDAQLDAFRIPPRLYGKDVLDQKPVNCVMPLVLATFCAWDGGELARTDDYQEIWGTNPQIVLNNNNKNTKVYVPWSTLLNVGDFNWRNGHGDNCPLQWPGCIDNPPDFYAFPSADRRPSDDNTPEIAAGGRFPLDVTQITSANGEGWYDVGANLMEAAWPNGTLNAGAQGITDVCNTTRTPGAGDTTCTRSGSGKTGIQVFSGGLPQVALVGYSFEGHNRRSETYLRTPGGAESLVPAGDVKPVTFQYGKVGGRCAR